MEKKIVDEYMVTNKRSSSVLSMHVEVLSAMGPWGYSSLTEWSSGGGVGEGLKKAMVVVVGEGEGEPVVGIS